MIEVMIERWAHTDRNTEYLWSVWRDGQRIQMGGPQTTADAAAVEAASYCMDGLGRRPDAVIHL